MSADLGLEGTEYSLASTMNNVCDHLRDRKREGSWLSRQIAQLCWMPFSTYLIVRVPANILMPALALGWGAAQACMGASQK